MQAFKLLTIGLLSLGGQIAHAADRIAYGTTALQSVHYTYGVAAAKAINQMAGDKVDVTVISTGGAVDNLARLARGQIHMGLGTFDTVYQAYKGIGTFNGNPQPKLRCLWAHAPSIQVWAVRKDSGVTSLEELAGKKINPGHRGSATEQLVIQMLTAMGVKPDLFRASLSDAVDAVKDNRAIGYVKAGGIRSLDGTTLEIQAFTPLRLLNFSQKHIDAIHGTLPFIKFITIRDGEIEGIPETTMPAQVVGQFALSDSLSNKQVEAILAGVVDGKGIQEAAFPGFKQVDVIADSLDLCTVPLHAGAVSFFRARGKEIPARLIP